MVTEAAFVGGPRQRLWRKKSRSWTRSHRSHAEERARTIDSDYILPFLNVFSSASGFFLHLVLCIDATLRRATAATKSQNLGGCGTGKTTKRRPWLSQHPATVYPGLSPPEFRPLLRLSFAVATWTGTWAWLFLSAHGCHFPVLSLLPSPGML